MSFELRNANGRGYVLELADEPSYCRSLRVGDPASATTLRSGDWIVLCAAVWSSPDLKAIPVAIQAVQRFHGRVQLGIVPFDMHDELLTMFPNLGEKFGSPIWIYLRSGTEVAKKVGPCDLETLKATIARLFQALPVTAE
jgi:hypothetical protein